MVDSSDNLPTKHQWLMQAIDIVLLLELQIRRKALYMNIYADLSINIVGGASGRDKVSTHTNTDSGVEHCLITPSCNHHSPLLGPGTQTIVYFVLSSVFQIHHSPNLQSWTEPANNNSAAVCTPLRTAGMRHVQNVSIPKCDGHTHICIDR